MLKLEGVILQKCQNRLKLRENRKIFASIPEEIFEMGS